MISRIPSACLAACPSFPNSVSWSEENLLAVAAEKLVIILNPTSPTGPRGFITVPPVMPFAIGRVRNDDLMNACMLPNCLRGSSSSCVRSIAWSPVGLAPNHGCFLAVCTSEGRVKIYNSTFPELRSEWTEVADISDMLCNYFVGINFEDSVLYNSTSNKTQNVQENSKYRKLNGHGEPYSLKKFPDAPPLITAEEYAYRNALMSTLTVAWSPPFHLSSDDELHRKCSVLALGGKSGHISFWLLKGQLSIKTTQNEIYNKPKFIGLIHAHSTWITAISFEICRTDTTRPQIVLATGASDGSVKVWTKHLEQLASTKFSGTCFIFLKELLSVTYGPVSSLSLVAMKNQPGNFILAIGRGSGMLEAWVWYLSSASFTSAGTFCAHDKVVTGLRWAFDGECLYSCSQDCCLRCWILRENNLQEISFPSNMHEKGASNVTQLSDPCFGLAFSPGSLIMSVVHGLDSNLLNPMYEARTQKAAVEFFWMGGRALETSLRKLPCHSISNDQALSERELLYWESDLIWVIKQFEDADIELVMWDVVTALQAFKESAPKVLESTLFLWLSSWCTNSSTYLSINSILSQILQSLSTMETRKLHLLAVICRRVFIDEASKSMPNSQYQYHSRNRVQSETSSLWENLLERVEIELCNRLVAFSFKAFLHVTSQPINDNLWQPSGVAQMVHWVASEPGSIPNEIKVLATNIRGIGSRLHFIGKYALEERCIFCSSQVPFEHPDIAFCSDRASTSKPQEGYTLSRCSALGRGGEASDFVAQGHKLVRCATSMQLCPLVPLWFCKCCQRWANDSLPEIYFKSSMSPIDDKFEILTVHLAQPSKPLCPYCGVLLQRSKPQFMLSASPV